MENVVVLRDYNLEKVAFFSTRFISRRIKIHITGGPKLNQRQSAPA